MSPSQQEMVGNTSRSQCTEEQLGHRGGQEGQTGPGDMEWAGDRCEETPLRGLGDNVVI